jgi:hypothetical protein
MAPEQLVRMYCHSVIRPTHENPSDAENRSAQSPRHFRACHICPGRYLNPPLYFAAYALIDVGKVYISTLLRFRRLFGLLHVPTTLPQEESLVASIE